ncbi:MAG: FAD-dependent monooxygenase, partial [Geminicoccaceae bacterium]
AELMRHGAPCRIVDRLAAPSPYCRAIGVTQRSLEVLEQMGVVDAMVDAGIWLHGYRMMVNGKVVAEVPGGGIKGVPYPSNLGLPQYATEAILTDHLARHGVAVERPTSLTSLRQSGDRVTVELTRADGAVESADFAYVVGCDGAHSTVRKGLGLAFAGEAYPFEFMLGDVAANLDLPPGVHLRAATFGAEGMTGFLVAIPLPEPGRFRVSMFSPPEEGADGAPTEDVAHGIQAERATPSLEQLQAAAAAVLPDVMLSDLRWSSIFRISLRLAEHYRVGRIFIAGDAAHIHPPTGGQGMNTGIQDAYNLAWKLARVMRGEAAPELLDSYEAERRPVARDVLERTHAETMAFAEGRAGGGNKEDTRLRDAQLAVSYRGGAWVTDMSALPGPVAGDRAPDAAGLLRAGLGFTQRLLEMLRGPGPVLLLRVAGQAELDGLMPRIAGLRQACRELRVLAIVDAGTAVLAQPGVAIAADTAGAFASAYGGGASSVWLVRPDHHIGYRADRLEVEDLAAYLRRGIGATGQD